MDPSCQHFLADKSHGSVRCFQALEITAAQVAGSEIAILTLPEPIPSVPQTRLL
jgi:hypothetical protein